MEASTRDETLRESWTALRRCFDWMLSQRDGEGRIVCPEHKVEHGGKNAGVIVMALALAKRAPAAEREELIAVALQQGDRLVANLVREGTSPCFTFRPGRHDPFNCSNSVIDGGAAADALGMLVRELREERSEDELAPYAAASLKHARTYLRYAVLDKGVPAQRAWGLTGLASAWALEADQDLFDAAREALQLLADVQHADGSYPYHPLAWGAGHAGASDVSAYYQSRVTAFCLQAMARVGREVEPQGCEDSMRRGLEFLLGLQGPDGIKSGLVEAKPWYWGANYEVASNSFDAAALAFGWQRFGDERYARAALRALDAWASHLDEDGAPRSHLAGPGRARSYQCPMFWAGHAMWIARALPLLEKANIAEDAPRPARRVSFSDAQLIRLEDEQVVAWVRGARPAVNVAHGSPHGAGLIRVQRKSDGRELLPRCRLGGHQAGEWCGRVGLPSLARGLRSGAREVRFSLWVARVHWRAGRRASAFKTPLASIQRGVLAFAHSRVSSAFALQPALELLAESGVLLRSNLAWRDGSEPSGTRIERSFEVDGRGLLVQERLLQADGVKDLEYRIPELATEVERSPALIRYRLA